jgi:glucose-6-phosphate isomerase
LRRAAEKRGIEILDHDAGIGGRYSALSLVGLLPAMIAGLDPIPIRQGAAEVLDQALQSSPRDCPPAFGAALNVALLWQKRIGTCVLMPYVDALASFGLWFRQLWAESLGKNGTGTTPIRAMGTVDQHSQLQLYLAGPGDKFYTLILMPRAGTGGRVAPESAADEAIAYLVQRSMGDLLDAEQRATLETSGRKRPAGPRDHHPATGRAHDRRVNDAFHARNHHRRRPPRRESIRPTRGGGGQAAGP